MNNKAVGSIIPATR